MKRTSILVLSIASLLLIGCGSNNPSSSTSISSSVVPTSISSSASTSISTSTDLNPEEGLQKLITNCSLSGTYSTTNDQIIGGGDNQIALATNSSLAKGTLSSSVTPTIASDTGIIFGVNRNGKNKFWEDGVSYYFYFISKSGSAYLGKVEDGSWSILNESAISGFSIFNTYKLSVSFDLTNNNQNEISCYLDDKPVYKVDDSIKTGGIEFGVRIGAKTSRLTFVNKSKTYFPIERQKVNDMYVASGKASYSKDLDLYTAIHDGVGTILFKEDAVSSGTFSVTLHQLGLAGCNGVIFGLDNDKLETFWESGISYYFFFIDENGFARLSKVYQGSWTDLVQSSSPVTNWTLRSSHALKINIDSSIIECFVDNVSLFTFSDESPLIGEYYGLRAGSFGTRFENFEVTKGGSPVYHDSTTYDVIKGRALTANETSFFSSGETVALKKDSTFSTGTFTSKLIVGNNDASGIIFKSDDTASNYYEFVIKGNFAKLIKVVNGVSTNLSEFKFITASHLVGSTENIIISIDGNTIRCYLRDILYVKYEDSSMLSGNRHGFKSMKSGSIYSGCSIDKSSSYRKTAQTLVMGHSYMEFWTNYKTDLSKFSDIHNIGIGGSVAEQWDLFKNEILDYEPTTIIYMIGTNDVFAYTPSEVEMYVESQLKAIRSAISGIQVALISCCRCPAREEYKTFISSLNSLYKTLCTNNTWIKYADIDKAFLIGDNPDPNCFKDGLHPKDEKYPVIANAIYAALGL